MKDVNKKQAVKRGRIVPCQRELDPGDLLLLFTDGLFEVTGTGDEEFGTERLLNLARQRMNLPMSSVVDGLIEDVQRFCQGALFEDDVCLLGVEVDRIGEAIAPHAK